MHNKRYVRLSLPATHHSPSKGFSWIWFPCLAVQQSKARVILKQNEFLKNQNKTKTNRKPQQQQQKTPTPLATKGPRELRELTEG